MTSGNGWPLCCQAKRGSGSHGRQSALPQCHFLDRQNGSTLAGLAGTVGKLELGVPAFQPLGSQGSLDASHGRPHGRRRPGMVVDRFDDHSGSSAFRWSKRGPTQEARSRSRGGFSTKVHIAVDALGNPVKFVLSEEQMADITGARSLCWLAWSSRR